MRLARLIQSRPASVGLVLAGLAAGSVEGRPAMAVAFAAVLVDAWIFAGFPAVLAASIVVVALASSSYVAVKDDASMQRWIALAGLAAWPLVSGVRPARRWPLWTRCCCGSHW